MEAPKVILLTEDDLKGISDFRAFDERIKYHHEDTVKELETSYLETIKNLNDGNIVLTEQNQNLREGLKKIRHESTLRTLHQKWIFQLIDKLLK